MKKISACPGWLDLSEDRRSFILVAEKAEIVRRIFQLSIGGLGSYSIAKQLDRKNIPAFGKSPKWDHTTIDSLLRNRATLGEHQPKSYAGGSKKGVPIGDPIPNYYPAIIDEETFVAAQTARQIHLASGRGRKGNDLANLFTGITTCAYCGEATKFYSNGNAKSLICARVLQGNGCIRFGWSYKNFEQSVLHFLSHPALLQNRSIDEQGELTTLIQQLGKLTEPNPLDARLAIASQLKAIVSELKISAGGKDPIPTHPASLIKRDHPARFFEVPRGSVKIPRVWSPETRPPDDHRHDDLAFFTTWCPAGTAIETLVAVEGHRWAIEDSFETAKNEFGLDHNESRSWHGWHRHVSMVMLAFAMMAVIRHHANPPRPKKTQRRTTAKTKPTPPRH